jgi:hypothetical protein
MINEINENIEDEKVFNVFVGSKTFYGYLTLKNRISKKSIAYLDRNRKELFTKGYPLKTNYLIVDLANSGELLV